MDIVARLLYKSQLLSFYIHNEHVETNSKYNWNQHNKK